MKKLFGLMLAMWLMGAQALWAQTAEQPNATNASPSAATPAASAAAQAQNPCTNGERRALIFSGGGLKGSFQAGAAWYLVVVRKCDFHDFAGVSVGGFNAALLAQACRSEDPVKSYTCMEAQTEALVGLWQSFKKSSDILHHKFLASIRFFVFGNESLYDSKPLARRLNESISFNRIANEGRPLRFGVTSMWDGSYREVTVDRGQSNVSGPQFIDYLLAGGSPPVMVNLPRNCEPGAAANCIAHQHGDGGMRSGVPVASYFPTGKPTEHGSLQQLWVLGTSIYTPGNTQLPMPCSGDCTQVKEILGKGADIMNRGVSVLIDTAYRRDLDFLQRANYELRWRAHLQEQLRSQNANAPMLEPLAGNTDDEKVGSLESFNADPNGGLSRPYTIGLIVPDHETLDLSALTNFKSETVQLQLLDGCLAADRLMNTKFRLESMKEKCMERFSPKPGGARKGAG